MLNEDRCTITIWYIDEDIVLSSAKKVAKQRTVPAGGEIAVTASELLLSFSFLAHLSRRLEWAIVIAHRPLSAVRRRP